MRASMLAVFMPSSGIFLDLVGSRSFSKSRVRSFSMPSSAFLNLPATTCLTMGRLTTKVEMLFLRASRQGTSSRLWGRKMASRLRRRSSQRRRKAQRRQKAGKSTYSMYRLKAASVDWMQQSRCYRAASRYGRKISIVGIISYRGRIRGRTWEGSLGVIIILMKGELASEMELLHQRIEENQFTCLKLYPNKSLLGKSRVARFTANSEFFEERCALFIEYAYLLLRVEAEQRPAFLSQHLFINHFGEVYLFYSFDPHLQDRLARVPPGGLLAAIITAFHRVFPPQTEQIADCEHQSIYENTLHCLIPYFDDLKERSEKYYYQSQGDNACDYDFRHEPSNPYSVLVKLEGSDLFREYNFPLKYNTAVLARGITDSACSNELRPQYLRLWEHQQAILREAGCLSSPSEVAKCVGSHYLQIFRYLQLLQKEAFLKVTVSEMDLATALESAKNDSACLLTFQSNLKKEPNVNRTSNEKSSESSIRNDRELTKEEKEKLMRTQEYLESLAIFKSKINFTAKVAFRPAWGEFEVELEAVSLWTIDEIYYYHFLDFWGAFINHWHNVAHQDNRLHERVATLKLDLFHRNKNIGLKTLLRVGRQASLAEELLVGYDQAVLVLLLLEPVLKKMYKMGYQFVNFSEKSFEELRQPTFIENKVIKLREALRRYTKYYCQLTALISS